MIPAQIVAISTRPRRREPPGEIMLMHRRPLVLAAVFAFATTTAAFAQQPVPAAAPADGTRQGTQTPPKPQTPPPATAKPAEKKPAEQKPDEKKPGYEETVVVSASKTEQQLV